MQNCNALCSVSESRKQNPRDRTLDLPFFFWCKHMPSLKTLPSPAPNESSAYWFQGNFAASFVFNFCLREFLLSALVNRFELRCEPKRLMLLYYKICPCCTDELWFCRMLLLRLLLAFIKKLCFYHFIFPKINKGGVGIKVEGWKFFKKLISRGDD